MAADYIIAVDLGQVSDPTAIAVLVRREQLTGRQEVVENIRPYFGYQDEPRYVSTSQTAGVYDIVHLERLELGTAYTAIPGRVRTIAQRLQQSWLDEVFHETGVGRARLDDAPVSLVLDQTGVGRPVVDLLREDGLNPAAITITG